MPVHPHLSPRARWWALLGFLIVIAGVAECSVGVRRHLDPATLHARIDALFHDVEQDGAPGYAVSVVLDGHVDYAGGFGKADLATGAEIETNTRFDIASAAKQFTAACLMLQVERGAVSLDDPVTRYLPELGAAAPGVTLRHLLHHTDGLPDYPRLMLAIGSSDAEDISDAALLGLLARAPREAPPGERFSYGDTGFYLLGKVIERTSGESLRSFAERELFAPLGMRDSFFYDDTSQPVPGRAMGYALTSTGATLSMSKLHVVGDGGLLTTVDDLARWEIALDREQAPISPLVRRLLFAPGFLSDGTPIGYASGLSLGAYRGMSTVGHSGAWYGFRADLELLPAQHLAVACAANFNAADCGQRVREIFDLYADAGRISPRRFLAAGPG